MTSATNQADAAAPWRLLDHYEAAGRVYDETVADGRVRPHFETLIRSLEDLGQHELASRWEMARRAVRANGITYNVYGNPEGANRSWELDMMPLVIAPAEWTRLERGLLQRARLLNLILSDIYGPQRLLAEGLLPPALLFANPAFLRPCHGIAVPSDLRLHLHGLDLTRSPDGQWWVLADRTQAPSGAGYALENRIVISRSLPETFRDCQVQRLASFFRAQRDALMTLAPSPRDQPRVVLLTPGPHNETYFEHAYLARYLGFTLVEGGDLTVRDRRVFIKTLDGLEPVDVIFRRLDDSFCDPLELRSDSSIGVAGLVEAARAGTVTIANALGSGVIETSAIMAFLPRLCRHLLGEDLLLPSVATWWCGQPAELAYVLEHLDELVVKRAFPPQSREPVFVWKLSTREKTALVAEMRARPEAFVGQDRVLLSTTPVWLGHGLEPRPLVLRTYVSSDGQTSTVMPGGLTRVAGARDMPVVSMQSGGGSKDTWVLSDGPVSPVSLLSPPDVTVRYERRATDLPSRVADNLFWLGRYAERAEQTMRLLRGVVARLSGEAQTGDGTELAALMNVLVQLKLVPDRFAQPVAARALEQDLVALLFRQNPPTALKQTLGDLQRITGVVRDRLSVDTWRILNQLQEDFRIKSGRAQFNDVLGHLNRMIMDLAAFSGMEMENMTRGHGWRFLDVGRRLERSVNLTTLVRTALEVSPAGMLGPLLEVADSTMTYRRYYFAAPQLGGVLDLLLSDATNTRALAFQLTALFEHTRQLPRDPAAPSPTREERLMAHAIARLKETDVDELGRASDAGTFPAVNALLDSTEDDLRALSDAITHFYFSHAELRVS